MTDQYDGPPRTRRERRERERAAQLGDSETVVEASSLTEPEAAAEANDTAPAADGTRDAGRRDAGLRDAGRRDAEAREAVSRDRVGTEGAAKDSEGGSLFERLRDSAPAASAPAPEAASKSNGTSSLFGAKAVSPTVAAEDKLPPTQAADLSELFGASTGQAPAGEVDQTPREEAADVETAKGEPAEPKRIGRFFGRRRRAAEDEAQQGNEAGELFDDIVRQQEPQQEPVQPVAVPAPSLALPDRIVRDEVQQLDTVNDAEVDASEIDEVETSYAPRSSKRVAEATPAELEDRRTADPAVEVSDDELPAGPIRSTGTSRLPVIVNVVSDTTEHHISDVLEETGSIERQSVGTGTSSITANALVLPSTGADEQIQIESEDGMIVTGSIDLPDGIASSGRSRGSVDGSDLDADAVHGEVRNPELQPVRASRAVSSYANARVQIAPDRRGSRAWPIAIGSGAAVVAVAAATFIAGLVFNWF